MNNKISMIELEEVLTERKEKPVLETILMGEIPIIAKIRFADGKIELRNESNTKTKMILIKQGDLVVSGINAAKGAIAIYGEQNTTPAAATIHYSSYAMNKEKVVPFYLWHFMRTDIFKRILIKSLPNGIKTEVKPKRLLPIVIPLPSLEEQKRIAEKIFNLTTSIKQVQSLRYDFSKRELPSLRNSIFRNAFQGKILLQDPNDEELLFPFQTKSRHLKKNIIKIEDRPYPLPKSWEWVLLGDICEVITDGTHQTPTYIEEGMPFLSAQNVKPYKFMPENHRCVSYDDYKYYNSKFEPKIDDILMARVGAGIGEAAIIDRKFDFAFYVSLCLIRPMKEFLNSRYLLHWLNSPFGVSSTRQYTLGRGHSQGNLNLIRRFVIPLPPLDEQYRISRYLDSIQEKMDELTYLLTEIERGMEELIPSILNNSFKEKL